MFQAEATACADVLRQGSKLRSLRTRKEGKVAAAKIAKQDLWKEKQRQMFIFVLKALTATEGS